MQRRNRRMAPPWHPVLMVMLLATQVSILPAGRAGAEPGPWGLRSEAPRTAPDVWLNELMARLAGISERRVTFRQQKRLASLSQPLTSQGQLYYRRPAHLEQTTTAPLAETVVIDGDRLTITLGDEAPRVLSVASHPEIAAMVEAVRGLLAGDLGRLRRHYHVQAEGGIAAWRLRLTPVDANTAGLGEVSIEGQDTDLHMLRIVQTNGDEQVMFIQAAP